MWRVLILLIIVHDDFATHIQNTFHKQKIIFNHLAVDYKTGAIYVGAVNRIFQLSPDLQVTQKVVTGPVYDSTLCSFDCIGVTKELKDNFNKALVIDYAHSRLITCGSVLQGMCSVRSLNNIVISQDVPKSVVANDPTSSTVVFIAPGPPDPNTTQVMYTGVTYTSGFAHRYHIPAVSSLSLEDHRLFDVAKTFCEFCHSDQVTGTRLYINTMYRDQFTVNYVCGFSSGAFSYFLTTQRSNDGVYHSKIIRICHNDEQYHSYTEIPVTCKNENNDYNIVDAGFVTKPGKNLAKELGISTGQDVLYALFHSENNYTSNNKVSALCIYTIRDINEKIGASIERCFRGEGMRGLAQVWPDRQCVKHVLKTRGADFCGNNVNTPLGIEEPIVTRPVAEFNVTLTAIAVTSLENHTVVFVGTADGHIKKITVKNATSVVEYGDIVVDKGSPVNKDLFLDMQQMYLYVMTKHKVSKVKVHQCNEHKSCSMCVRAGDPYCGWCIVENKCSSQLECMNGRLDPLFWLSYNTSQCIVIAQVTPVHIPENVVFTFTDPVPAPSSQFNHLVVDRNTGQVYVGAVNRIYQLSPNLEVAQSLVTGPVGDSEFCTFECPSDIVKKPTDNVNKAMVIDYATSRLITCGSVFQGICSVRSLNNISHYVREVRELVVANDAIASTVAFIGPGPPNPPVTQVMYVGVTFTSNSPYRSEIPTVSSRSLEDDRLFMIAQDAVITGTRMFVNSFARERYIINYVYGFSSEGFSYFLTTQLRYLGSDTYYSKLIRVCHDDENYYSYTEIPISCNGEKKDSNYNYNLVQAAFVGKPGSVLAGELEITVQHDVLFAAFSQSESINTNTPSDISALCVYSLKAIRRKFMQNIQTCFNGNGSRGLDFISPSHPCVKIKPNFLHDDYCGLDVNTPLGGEQPVEAIPIAVFKKRITAVVASATGNYTVVFAGTTQGHLKKIMVESATTAFEYGDIVVDEGSPVNKDLIFDNRQMYLYVMTERKISKVKVHECYEYKTCLTCVNSKDPYCEWCEAENKCGLRTECKSYGTNNAQCSLSNRITTVGRTAKMPLQLIVDNMPSSDAELLCVFTLLDLTLVMNATRRDYGVDCLTPDSEKMPRPLVGQHEHSAKLSLTTINGTEFAATKLTFYACSSYSSCTQCTSSPYGCNWDLTDSVCIDAASQMNSMIITNKLSTEQARTLRPMCPQLLGPEQLLVPAAVNASINVKVRGIKPKMADKLYCMFKVESKTIVVEGKFFNDTVRCGNTALDYRSNASVIIASITIAWDGWKLLDNPRGVHLKVYKCAVMASDERTCNQLPKMYTCLWKAKGTCEYQKTRVNKPEPVNLNHTDSH